MNAIPNPTIGIVRDDRCLEHKRGHTHPEHPNRLKAVYRMLDGEFPSHFGRVQASPATLEDLELIHSPAYVQKVLKTAHHKYTSLAPGHAGQFGNLYGRMGGGRREYSSHRPDDGTGISSLSGAYQAAGAPC